MVREIYAHRTTREGRNATTSLRWEKKPVIPSGTPLRMTRGEELLPQRRLDRPRHLRHPPRRRQLRPKRKIRSRVFALPAPHLGRKTPPVAPRNPAGCSPQPRRLLPLPPPIAPITPPGGPCNPSAALPTPAPLPAFRLATSTLDRKASRPWVRHTQPPASSGAHTLGHENSICPPDFPALPGRLECHGRGRPAPLLRPLPAPRA